MTNGKYINCFNHGLYNPTLKNFLIINQCKTFNHTCMIMMGFEDSMTNLQTPSDAIVNPTRQVPQTLMIAHSIKKVDQPSGYVV